jgi:hypothetical protein
VHGHEDGNHGGGGVQSASGLHAMDVDR